MDVRGKDGRTCLHWAVDKNHPRIVKAVLVSKKKKKLWYIIIIIIKNIMLFPPITGVNNLWREEIIEKKCFANG